MGCTNSKGGPNENESKKTKNDEFKNTNVEKKQTLKNDQHQNNTLNKNTNVSDDPPNAQVSKLKPKQKKVSESSSEEEIVEVFGSDDSDSDGDIVDIMDDPTVDGDSESKLEKEREDFVRTKFDILSTKVPFFAQFRKDHQIRLFEELHVVHYNDGDLIVKQGDYGDRMYLIIEGEAAVWREDGDKTIDITHLYKYDYFGELALVYGQVRNANVSAVKRTSAMYLSKGSFEKFEEIRVYMIVQKIPLLSRLRPDMQTDIVQRLKPQVYAKGENVVTQGDIGDAFYMIAQGSAEVVENGETMTRLYEGHTFGQMALLSGAPRNATVRAAEPLICFELKAADFQELLERNSDFKQLLQTDVRVIKGRRIKRDERKKTWTATKPKSTRTLEQSKSSNPLAEGSQPSASFYSESREVRSNSAGLRVVNGYVIDKVIGEGTFGVVNLCYGADSGMEFAIKIIDKSKIGKGIKSVHAPGIEQMREEVAIMKRLTHPNIVNLISVIDDPEAQHLYIVQEYCAHGAIMSGLDNNTPLSEATARDYFRDLLQGLDYLHANNVIHRDIKPMNLLLTSEDVVKIADFGAARMIVGDTKWISGVTGTPAFMAPELLVEDSDSYNGPAVDLWSCGATLYMMVTGVPPWISDDEIKLARKVKNDELLFPSDWNKNNYSPHLKNLIQKLLVKDPNSRPTLAMVMEHDWVTDEGSDLLERWHPDTSGDAADAPPSRGSDASVSGTELRDAITPRIMNNSQTDDLDATNVEADYSSDEGDNSEGADGSNYQGNMFDFQRMSSNDPHSQDINGTAPTLSKVNANDMSILDDLENMGTSDKVASANDLKVLDDLDMLEISDSESKNVHLDSIEDTSEAQAKGCTKVSWAGIKFALHLDQNTRSNMEDTIHVETKLQRSGILKKAINVFYAGVFDGHGGELVSKLLSEKLHFMIRSQSAFPNDMGEALRLGFLAMDRLMLQEAARHLLEHQQKVASGAVRQGLVRTKGDRNQTQDITEAYQKAGSTAVVCTLFRESAKDPLQLAVAWVGDTRAVLSRSGVAVDLTQDHKSSRADETARVRAAGGTVDRKGRIDGSLAVSRAFGDLLFKGHNLERLAQIVPLGPSPDDDSLLSNGAVIPLPDIYTKTIERDDEFIIISSDGIWDVLSSQDAVDFVRQQLKKGSNVDKVAKRLLGLAKERNSIDNMSVVIIQLRSKI